MSENAIEKNLETYKNGLIKLIGKEATNNIIEYLGGEKKLAYASYAYLENTGAAFEGSFIKNVIRMTRYANAINDVLPTENRCNKDSLNKVCMLSQIAKVISYEKNDNSYEVSRGKIYKFTTLPGALRGGERSALIALKAGVDFSEIEYEAMKILDRTEDDDYAKYFSSTLSMVVKHAAEMVNMVNKESYDE